MTNDLLDVTARCRGNDRCLFEGKDLFLDISIANNQKFDIDFPLTYRRKTGPIIRLIDTRTRAETNLQNNLASKELLKDLTRIRPGESVVMGWVITSDELRQFGPHVDLTAEITVMAKVQAGGKEVDFRGVTTLRIVSKDKQ